MTINERFQAIIDLKYNGNKSAFAKAVGVGPTVVENVVGGRKGKPSFDFLEKVCANANISEEWILSGRGDMLKTKETLGDSPLAKMPVSYCKDNKNLPDSQENIDYVEEEEVETRPRIPYEAAAGSLSIAMEGITDEQCEQLPVISTLPRYDFTIIVRGNSMEPEFHSGDEIACAFVSEKRFIQWGRTHVLDTADGILLKKIFHQGKDLLCRSFNPEYPDFTIPKDEIYHMAIVVGLVRSF